MKTIKIVVPLLGIEPGPPGQEPGILTTRPSEKMEEQNLTLINEKKSKILEIYNGLPQKDWIYISGEDGIRVSLPWLPLMIYSPSM